MGRVGGSGKLGGQRATPHLNREGAARKGSRSRLSPPSAGGDQKPATPGTRGLVVRAGPSPPPPLEGARRPLFAALGAPRRWESEGEKV